MKCGKEFPCLICTDTKAKCPERAFEKKESKNEMLGIEKEGGD